MLIAEHIEVQRQKVRVAGRTFCVLLVVSACAFRFLPLPAEFDNRTRTLFFVVAFVLAAIVSQTNARRALRCPRCHGSLLRPLLTIKGPVKRCPLCSADFHEVMPGQA
jgi:hypothetical protein